MKTHYIKFSKKTYLYALLILFSLTSCKKEWLEAKSDNALTVPASLSDYQGLLDNVNTMIFQVPSIGEIASDGHYVTDVNYQSATKNFATDAYIWSKTMSHINVSDWNQAYSKILIDNIVLDGLNKILPNEREKEQWSDIKGQALFHRAKVFFDLSQIYASPFNEQNSSQDLGVVLRLSSDITIASKRSTLKETYAQILKDLKEAKLLLPIRPKILTRGSVTAVNALLVRVYLSMDDYENAFTAADDCLKQYSELLDLNEIPATATFIGRYNREVILHSNFQPGFLVNSGLIDQTFFNLYKANDLRTTRFFRLNTNNTITFKGHYENLTTNFFCGLTTDEVYLSRAECFARKGNTIDAMKDLNNLIIKKWDKNVPYPVITALNADDALLKILEERKKELVFRGVRWMDLRRLNKDIRFALTLKRTILGTEYTLEPNSYKYTFPIPDDVIQQTGMKQNPGWL